MIHRDRIAYHTFKERSPEGCIDYVKFYIEYYDINDEMYTDACMEHIHGCELNLEYDYGKHTLLMTACRADAPIEVIDFILESKADINAECDGGDRGPVTAYDCTSNAEIMKFLKKKGFLFPGATPLHSCVDVEDAKLLIEAKADVNAKDNMERTPLFYCDDVKIASFLIENRADIEIEDTHGDTFEYHVSYDFVDLLKILCEEKILFKPIKVFSNKFFKKNTEYSISCILNYDNDIHVSKIIKTMIEH